MSFINLSAYRFVTLTKENLPQLQADLKNHTVHWKLKGTLLLSTEGINLFVAGLQENITAFKQYLNQIQEFANLPYKESLSATQPFKRMLVKIKQEIIPMGVAEIKPEEFTAPHLSPTEFKRWYDENKDMVVLDTRNEYEMRLGTFKNAMNLHLRHFRNFPQAIEQLPEELKDKTIVTFCTGGIRCEKAAALMAKKGFKKVYQLDGGILSYFEKCGGAHYEGECFVFDERVAVDPQLQETKAIQCYGCRNPLLPEEQYPQQEKCPYCGEDGKNQG